MRSDVVNHLVHGVAGLHHQHDAPWPLQHAHQLFDRVGAGHLRPLGFVRQKVVYLCDGAVEDGNLESVVVHVEYKILSHDGKADQADITHRFWHNSLRAHILAFSDFRS